MTELEAARKVVAACREWRAACAEWNALSVLQARARRLAGRPVPGKLVAEIDQALADYDDAVVSMEVVH